MAYLITLITQAKRNPDRVNIFLNNSFWLGLSKNDLLSQKITKGRELSESEKVTIESVASAGKLHERALDYLNRRPRSVAELRSYLVYRKKYSEEEVAQLLEKLQADESLSDEKFARWYAEYKLSQGSYGLNKIKMDLRAKGVKADVVSRVLEDYGTNENHVSDQAEKLREYATKIIQGIKAKNDFELRAKLTARLVSRGFSYGEVKAAVKEVLSVTSTVKG